MWTGRRNFSCENDGKGESSPITFVERRDDELVYQAWDFCSSQAAHIHERSSVETTVLFYTTHNQRYIRNRWIGLD